MAVMSRTQLFDAIVIVVGNYFVHGQFSVGGSSDLLHM